MNRWYWQKWNLRGGTLVEGRYDMFWSVGRLEAHAVSEEARQLIAAAPALLEVLEELRRRYATVTERGGIEVAITSDLYEQIEAALALATGRAGQC